jgi:hypothetical protein
MWLFFTIKHKLFKKKTVKQAIPIYQRNFTSFHWVDIIFFAFIYLISKNVFFFYFGASSGNLGVISNIFFWFCTFFFNNFDSIARNHAIFAYG